MSGGPSGVRRPAAGALLLAALAWTVSGCGLVGGAPEPEGGEPTAVELPAVDVPADDPADDPALARFYGQDVAWRDCAEGVQCAEVVVPVDWDDPAGATLGTALARVVGGEPGGPALLFDPGGPGASGRTAVAADVTGVVTPAVAERYDVVGLDPRGVGGSEPVDCLDDRAFDAYLAADNDVDEPGGVERLRASARDFGAACLADAGPLLGEIDTVSAARDMDVVRAAALGQDRLDYLGASYGTELGATYADLFPHRVGRFVLDAAVDPSLTATELSVAQAAGFESALRAYVRDCPQREDCPLAADLEAGLEQVRSVAVAADAAPLPTGDAARPLTEPLALSGTFFPLYAEQLWPQLDLALERGLRGDGSGLLALADAYAQRGPDGRYASNLLEAFPAVSCLDRPVDDSEAAMERTAAALAEASPTFGRAFAYGEVSCGEWPVPATGRPGPREAEGAAPILVVGTTNDPATPYAWSKALADQLSSGVLLTREGEGHTAYRRGSDCTDAAIDAYLLDGVVPGQDATCER